MESTSINSAKKTSGGGGEKETVKTGQDGTAEEVEVAGEMKQLASQVNQVVCGGRPEALTILPEDVTKSTRITKREVSGALYSDFVHLRQILPDEIWKLVTEKLPKENSEDLEALANSSLFFRNLLASQRTLYLFEKVVQLVASTIWKQEGLEELPLSDVLKCRAVCSHWNAVIDKAIPEKFTHFGEGSMDIQTIQIATAFKSITNPNFSNFPNNTNAISKSILNFLRHFDRSHPGNQSKGRDPLIWGNISLAVMAVDEDVEEYGNYQRYLEAVSTLLSKYGTHFHTFSLQIEEFGNGTKLVEWLSCIPNIKVLKFQSDGDRWWEDDYYTERNFPKWKYLETLDTKDLPAPLFNQLIRQNSQVSTLVIGVYEVDYDFFSFPLPNLRTLKMGYCTIDDVQKLRLAEKGQWPLESLTMEFGNDCGGIDDLFQVLHDMFGDTLAVLHLEMMEIEREEGPLWLACTEYRLDLPKLRKISLVMHLSSMCLDFLLTMKHNLEEISVQVVYQLPRTQIVTLASGTIVQFMGFEEKMLESNIWAIFKKLKKVEVKAGLESSRLESRWYAREDWMLNNEYN